MIHSPLIIQPRSGIGDMIWHLRTIHAIAARSETGKVCIATLASSHAKDLLKADPTIERVDYIDHHSFWRSVQILRSFHAKQVWILHNSTKHALLCVVAGIPERIGYGYKLQKLFLTNKKITPQPDKSYDAIDKALVFLETHGLTPPSNAEKLVCDQKNLLLLRNKFYSSQKPWVAFGIGSGVSKRQYPAILFSQVATQWLRLNGGTIFLSGGMADHAMAKAIQTNIPSELQPNVKLALDFSIDEQGALLFLCDLFVGNDSGLLNIAASVGTHAIGLFGVSPPLRYLKKIHAVVPNKQGMVNISPESILESMKTCMNYPDL